jgi:hypothetical protein
MPTGIAARTRAVAKASLVIGQGRRRSAA